MADRDLVELAHSHRRPLLRAVVVAYVVFLAAAAVMQIHALATPFPKVWVAVQLVVGFGGPVAGAHAAHRVETHGGPIGWEAQLVGVDVDEWRTALETTPDDTHMTDTPTEAGRSTDDHSSRTPAWWRSLPTAAQVAILVVLWPGVVLHELTHAGMAYAVAAGSPTYVWDEIGVQVEWSTRSAWRRAAVHLAPALIGAIATAALFATFLTRPQFTAAVMTLPLPLIAYFGLNWSAFCGLSLTDVAGVEYLRVYVEGVLEQRTST